MKSFLEEFRKFALRGNVVDLAIGVVIGTAFNNITNSLVTNIITPPLGLLLGRIDFQNWVVGVGGSATIKYGLFVQSVVQFIITALAIFIVIRSLNRLQHLARNDPAPEPPPPAAKSPELVVLEDIRDMLKKQSAHGKPVVL